MNQQEIDLYREVYDSMYAGIEKLSPGNTTADVAKCFPKYDDDKYGTCTLQQFAHSIGITLYEGMWISPRLFVGVPGGDQGEHVLRRSRPSRGIRGSGRPAGWRKTSWSAATDRSSSR